jgi:hypothetical protein
MLEAEESNACAMEEYLAEKAASSINSLGRVSGLLIRY